MSSLHEAEDALALNRQLQHRLQDMLTDLDRIEVNLVVLVVVGTSGITIN